MLYVLGTTRSELGGSLWAEVNGQPGGQRAPRSILELAPALFRALHAAIRRGLVRSCHDLSAGGLAVALAEMALAGGLGAEGVARSMPRDEDAADDFVLLFSESPTRFLLEVAPRYAGELEDRLAGLPLGRLDGSRPIPTVLEFRASPSVDRPGLDGSVVVHAVRSRI